MTRVSCWLRWRRLREDVFLKLFIYTGCRKQEVATLLWEDVDFAGRTLTVTGKYRKIRKVPLHPALAEVLERWQALNPDQKFVLASQRGNRITDSAVYEIRDPVRPSRHRAGRASRLPGMRGFYVAVLNVTGTNGAANAAAANLEARGVHVSYIGNGAFTEHPTAVLYRSGAKRPARALARALHLPAPKRLRPALAPSIGIARIVVLVGPGGVHG